MNVKKKNRGNVRDKILAITLTEEEKKIIQNEAHKNGLTLSAYSRNKLIYPLRNKKENEK